MTRERATAKARRELEREQQPRTLVTRAGSEPRVARVDEDQVADAARRDQQRQERVELTAVIARMEGDLERVRALAPRVAAGVDHRSALRAITYGIRSIRRLVD